MQGTITKAISSFYYVDTKNGLYECKARGVFKLKAQQFVVGDVVEIEILDEENKKAVINRALERKNLLKRPPIANVTQAILLFAIKNPDPNLSLIDRFLVLAQKQDLEIIIALNKIDLDEENLLKTLEEIYTPLGYPIAAVSAEGRQNVEPIKKLLKNQISIVAGPSGAGKSTLINALIDTELKTGQVSEKIGRGRHTTRYVELIQIDDSSYIADSPGFSSIDLDEIEEKELKEYFVEFHEYDEDCRFGAKCLHENEPNCAVRDAVDENKISSQRYKSYLQLLGEIRETKRRRY